MRSNKKAFLISLSLISEADFLRFICLILFLSVCSVNVGKSQHSKGFLPYLFSLMTFGILNFKKIHADNCKVYVCPNLISEVHVHISNSYLHWASYYVIFCNFLLSFCIMFLRIIYFINEI